ncbi:MAG: hypothetical protein U0804_03370 [Gemmataceae bacterium]
MPSVTPDWVTPPFTDCPSRLRASPMSTILARPSGVMMRLLGLMSRWTTPRSAAWCSPAATWIM